MASVVQSILDSDSPVNQGLGLGGLVSTCELGIDIANSSIFRWVDHTLSISDGGQLPLLRGVGRVGGVDRR